MIQKSLTKLRKNQLCTREINKILELLSEFFNQFVDLLRAGRYSGPKLYFKLCSANPTTTASKQHLVILTSAFLHKKA